MTAPHPLSAILLILDGHPVLKERFSEEQLKKYRIIAARLSESAAVRPFRIVFCGVFSSGKTSLINTLLASAFRLPEGVNPVTKLVTRIRGGTQVTCAYRQEGREIPLPVDAVEGLIKGQKQLIADSSELVIYLPSAILDSTVEFIDTPGFNDEMGGELEQMSREAIYEADMAVMCCNALQLGKIFERQLLQELDDSMGHFSLAVTRMDNLNTTDDCHAVIRQANRMMQHKGNDAAVFPGDPCFVFPMVATGDTHTREFANYLKAILGDSGIRQRIRASSDAKSSALCLKEIHLVFEEIASRLRDELAALNKQNDETKRQRAWDAQVAAGQFGNVCRQAGYAAQAFAEQRMGVLAQQIRQLRNPNTFQASVSQLTGDMMNALICDIAAYSGRANLADAAEVTNVLRWAYLSKPLIVPPPFRQPVKRRGVIKRCFRTLRNLLSLRFQIDDGCDMEFVGYQEPAVQAVCHGPVQRVLQQWESYLERRQLSIKTTDFAGGCEQTMQDKQALLDLCQTVLQMT